MPAGARYMCTYGSGGATAQTSGRATTLRIHERCECRDARVRSRRCAQTKCRTARRAPRVPGCRSARTAAAVVGGAYRVGMATRPECGNSSRQTAATKKAANTPSTEPEHHGPFRQPPTKHRLGSHPGSQRHQPGVRSEWWGSHNLPAVPFRDPDKFAVIERRRNIGMARQLFKEAASSPRHVKKQHTAGLGAGTLPRVRDIAGHEGAGSGAANRDLVADLECDLAAQDVGHLIAVVMEVHRRHGAGRCCFLEHHHALFGIAVL